MLNKKRTFDAVYGENKENNNNITRQRIAPEDSPKTSSSAANTSLARSASSESTNTSLNSLALNSPQQPQQPNVVLAQNYNNKQALISMLDAIPVEYQGCKNSTFEVKTYTSKTQPHQFVCEKQRGFRNFIYAISHLIDPTQYPYKDSSAFEITFLSNTPVFKFLARTPNAKSCFIDVCEGYLNKRLAIFTERTGACLGDFGWPAEKLLPTPVLQIQQNLALPQQQIIPAKTPSEQLQGILSFLRVKFIGKRFDPSTRQFTDIPRDSYVRFDTVSHIKISGQEQFKEFIKTAFHIANPDAFRNDAAGYRCTTYPLGQNTRLLDFLRNESAFRAIQTNRFTISTALSALKEFCEELLPTFTTTTDKLEKFLPETKNVGQTSIARYFG